MKYIIRRTKSFKKSYDRCKKRGLDITKLDYIVALLENDIPLPPKYYDHKLLGSHWLSTGQLLFAIAVNPKKQQSNCINQIDY